MSDRGPVPGTEEVVAALNALAASPAEARVRTMLLRDQPRSGPQRPRRPLLRPDVEAGDDHEAADPAGRRDRRRRAERLKSRGGAVSLNLTPMIDVVFQLLVFFVCTTRTLDAESVFRLDVPGESQRGAAGAESADAASAFELPRTPLRIHLSHGPDGPVIRLEPPLGNTSTVEQLASFLASSRRGAEGRGLFAGDHPMELVPDAEAPWEDVVAAFNAVLRARFTNVGFGRGGS